MAHEQLRQLPLQMQQQARGIEKSPANLTSERGKTAVGQKCPQILANSKISLRYFGLDFVFQIEGSILDLLIRSETNFINNYRRGLDQLFTLLHETKIESVIF